MAAAADTSNLVQGVRAALLYSTDLAEIKGAVVNLAIFSLAVAIVSFLEMENHRKRFFICLSLAVLINLITGARMGTIVLILSLLAIDWLKTQRLRWKLVALLAIFSVFAFSLIALTLKKGADNDASLGENARSIARQIVAYTSGGIVAFDRTVQHRINTVHNQKITRSFIPVLNKLGAQLDEPLAYIDTNFVDTGPEYVTNVFSIFFSYMEWGLLCCLFLFAIIGFIVTFCFERAMLGSRPAMSVYGFLFAGLVLSIFADFFFVAVGFAARIYLVAWCVYKLPGFVRRVKGLMKFGAVQEALARAGDSGS